MSLSETDILDFIASDPLRVQMLREVAALELPDCWIGAGFVRNCVWDHLHGFDTPTPFNDIDVIYFDTGNLSKEMEARIKAALAHNQPGVNWDVKNQARMHLENNDPPYASAVDALTFWPETATAIAVRLWDKASDRLELAAPLGIEDLVHLRIRPTPAFVGKAALFNQRMKAKNWQAIWPRLEVLPTLSTYTSPSIN